MEHGIERVGDSIWRMLRHRPYVGVGLAFGAGLGAAALFGAGELVIGIAAAYAAYQMLKRKVAPSEAIREVVALEKNIP